MLRSTWLPCILGPIALAQPHERAEIHADDASAFAQFGQGAVLTGDLAVIGASEDSEIAKASGAIYVFDVSDPDAPQQLSKFKPDDAAFADRLGDVIACDATLVLAGAPWVDRNGLASVGVAYLIDISDPTQPIEVDRLVAADVEQGMRFGSACAIEDGLALVGAPDLDLQGSSSGAAYIFDVRTGEQLARIAHEELIEQDEFCITVALDDGIAYIAARSIDNDESGSIYVYSLADPGAPAFLTRIMPQPALAHMQFGASIDVENGLLAAGAPGDDELAQNAGSVFLFDVSDPARPAKVARIFRAQPGSFDNFGWSVSLHADTLLAGAADDHIVGALHYIDVTDPANPIERAKLVPTDDQQELFFSVAIDLNDEVILAGAPGSHAAAPFGGVAYLFDADPCFADVNGDGDLNILDFVAFQLQWGADAAVADCDGDGAHSILDFVCFQSLFQSPCP